MLNNNIDIGVRINPLYSEVEVSKYNSSNINSRLGIHINQLDKINNNSHIIFIERSVFCDRNVFAKTCYENKDMEEIQWIIYNKWFSWMITKYKNIFDKIEGPTLEMQLKHFKESFKNSDEVCVNLVSIDSNPY